MINKSCMKAALFIRFLPGLFILPLVWILWSGLSHDPKILPSALIGKSVPQFTLPTLVPGKSFSTADLMGQPSMVVVFASWCSTCVKENKLLLALKKQGSIRIIGLAYKDKPTDVKQWLNKHGNPFSKVMLDSDGQVSIDWGVYGTPETFLVSESGRITYKHVGALTTQQLIKELAAQQQRKMS